MIFKQEEMNCPVNQAGKTLWGGGSKPPQEDEPRRRKGMGSSSLIRNTKRPRGTE